MTMKQLFKHTSTIILRAALLLGTIAFVNTQTQAQTAEQLAAMPNAFLTMDPASIIGDGQYYYIQFYFNSDISFLSDQGNGNAMRTKDYIPFAQNIQWTLEGTGTENQFKLKSRSGNWAYLDGTSYKCTNDEGTASTFTFYNHKGGGYEIGTTTNTNNAMVGNANGKPWIDIYDGAHSNHQYARCCLRIAKLKSNIAHIIYYQEPIYKSGQATPVDANTDTRADAAGFTKHHYLTYSGTDQESWESVITNGDFSGTDVSCFRTNGNVGVTITDEAGRLSSRGVKIYSPAGQANPWDKQFFIRANTTNALPVGTKIHVEFDYKADKSATVGTQSHGEPGTYHGGMFGDLNFTTNWQTFSTTIEVVSDMVRTEDDFRTIAFNLGRTGEQEAVTFY